MNHTVKIILKTTPSIVLSFSGGRIVIEMKSAAGVPMLYIYHFKSEDVTSIPPEAGFRAEEIIGYTLEESGAVED